MMLFAIAILLCAVSSGQEQSGPFRLRVADFRWDKFTCTALTEDGRLRREVTPVVNGGYLQPEVREINASESDVQRLRAIVLEPEFQNIAKKNPEAGMGMILPDGRMIFVEMTINGEHHWIAFHSPNGTSRPEYLKPLFVFTEEVKDRELPKLDCKTAPVCPLPKRRNIIPLR